MIIRKCFTVNQHRTTAEFIEYDKLIKEGLFQAIEIFFPYDKTKEEFDVYTQNVYNLMKNNIEVVLHLPFGFRNDLCDEEEYDVIIQRMKDAIDYSKQFNVEKLTLHLGACKKDGVYKDREKLVAKSIETVKLLCDYAYPQNIMIENMPTDAEIGYSPEEIKHIITKSNRSNIKFILDFGHANVSEYKSAIYINELKEHLYHLHINDNDESRDQHKPIGSGNVEFDKLFRMLSDYKELYCLEIIYKDHNDLRQYENDLTKITNKI